MKYLYIIKILILQLFFSGCVYSQTRAGIDDLLKQKNKDWGAEKTVNYFNSIYNSSQKIGYEKGMYESLLSISYWYMYRGDYKNAIPYLDKIEKLPVKNVESYKYKVSAEQDKVYAFTNLGFYDDANATLEKSFLYSDQLKSDDKNYAKGAGYDLKSALYIELKKPEDSVLFYLKKSLSYYLKIKNPTKRKVGLKLAYLNISISFLEKKEADSALFYSYKVKSMGQIGRKAEASISQTIGSAHILLGRLDSALIYYKKSERNFKIIGYPVGLKSCYENLSEIYQKLNDKDSALIYSNKYGDLVDSLSLADKKVASIASQSIKKNVQAESQKEKYPLYWIIGSVIILLALALLFLWSLLRNYHRVKESSAIKKNIIIEKDHELNELKSKVNDSFKEIVSLAKENDPSFLGKFKEVYPEFCNHLQEICPDILNSELCFCAYLKLNFSTKEIAAYTFVASKTVQNKKNRIRKRLNIPSNEDIYIWINKI